MFVSLQFVCWVVIMPVLRSLKILSFSSFCLLILWFVFHLLFSHRQSLHIEMNAHDSVETFIRNVHNCWLGCCSLIRWIVGFFQIKLQSIWFSSVKLMESDFHFNSILPKAHTQKSEQHGPRSRVVECFLVVIFHLNCVHGHFISF